MTNNYLSYGKPRAEIDIIARTNAIYQDLICISDIDGVYNATKSLKFYDLTLTAIVVLQPLFKEFNFLTGRYAQLFMNDGIPRLRALGWNFNKPCSVIAEMGGVSIRPTDRISIPEHDLAKMIIEKPEDLIVNSDKWWAATAHAPKITPAERAVIYVAYKRVLERYVQSGNLEHLGISRDADIDALAPNIYDPESFNFFKGTLTTSIVPQEYKDLAFAVHKIIGADVSEEINRDLEPYNTTAARKLIAVNHLDCVEVLFDNIAKLPTTLDIISNFEDSSYTELKTVLTMGDAYKDIDMARAAVQLHKQSIHFHFGHAADFEKNLREDVRDGLTAPDFTVLFPEYDESWTYNPGLTSVNTTATALWSFIKVIRENGHARNWLDLLRKINNAKVITKDDAAIPTL
ncbi:hypothetical protein FWF89_01815 [Candidatus Saccharibacteria bacterium]|nr:hypothetical protein [Candidatus Saccharibacteria bacterium]